MTEENKKLVHTFYDLAFNQHTPREAASLYIGDQYIQHNPFVPNGVARLPCCRLRIADGSCGACDLPRMHRAYRPTDETRNRSLVHRRQAWWQDPRPGYCCGLARDITTGHTSTPRGWQKGNATGRPANVS
jgi:hypothetical protein